MTTLTDKQIQTLVEVRDTGCASSHKRTVPSLLARGLIIAMPSNWGFTDYKLSPSGWAVFEKSVQQVEKCDRCGERDRCIDPVPGCESEIAADDWLKALEPLPNPSGVIALYERWQDALDALNRVPLDDGPGWNSAYDASKEAQRAVIRAEAAAYGGAS